MAIRKMDSQTSREIDKMATTAKESPAIRPIQFPGSTKNFKGKQYNIDDLSSVLTEQFPPPSLKDGSNEPVTKRNRRFLPVLRSNDGTMRSDESVDSQKRISVTMR